MDCSPKVKTVNIADVAIDNLATLPDFFLAERDVEDITTGNIVRTPVRVRSSDIFPNVSNDNVIAIELNNTGINVPERQVRGGYVENGVGSNIVRYANNAHKAVFLMLGKHADNLMRIQNTGFVNIPEGHSYVVGAQYYLGNDGQPVTDSSITGQKLFVPISNTKLAINM